MGTFLAEFNRYYKELIDIYHDMALQIGLSDSAFDIFYYLCEHGDGCLQRDICASTHLPKQTIHSSICKLETEGYLTLARGKGRSMRISLTDAGKLMMQETVLPMIRLENEAFSCMTPDECRQMLALQSRYTAALRDGLERFSQSSPSERKGS